MEFTAHKKYYIGKIISLIAGKGGLLARLILWMKKSNTPINAGASDLQLLSEGAFHSACVTITDNNRKYKLFLPYMRNKLHDHTNKTIYLVKGTSKFTIPHPPGFKFQVNAARLGGDSIVVIDNDSNEETVFSTYQDVDY
jgi:hypothetical protein